MNEKEVWSLPSSQTIREPDRASSCLNTSLATEKPFPASRHTLSDPAIQSDKI